MRVTIRYQRKRTQKEGPVIEELEREYTNLRQRAGELRSFL